MTIEMIEVEEFNQGTQIKVIGVGGGGLVRPLKVMSPCKGASLRLLAG